MVYELEDYESIAKKSTLWTRPPTKQQKKREMKLFGELRDRKPPFESFSKRLKFQSRYSPEALWNEIFISTNKEKYMEELRRQNQSKLSRLLHMRTAKRLGVTESVKEDCLPLSGSGLNGAETTSVTAVPAVPKNKKQLQFSRNGKQLRVSIHPYTIRRGRRRNLDITGTLQAHANGFRFSNYSVPFQMDVMYDTIKHAFFQDGDEQVAPFLHLHLHNPVMLGTEMTKDIQFRMVRTSEGCTRKEPLALDSDKLGQKQQKTGDNLLMQKFVWAVDFLWRPLGSIQFHELERSLRFHAGIPVKNGTSFSSFIFMTLYCIVHLREKPFLVVTLKEIEVVNLVQMQSLPEVFNMTIVFKDFKREVLKFYSIPLAYLVLIKEWLDIRGVKYYENKYELNTLGWGAKLEMIMDDPTDFIQGGGWEFLNSGENATQYSDSSAESLDNCSDFTSYSSDDSGLENEKKCTTRTKLAKPAIRRVNVVMSDESDA